MFKSDKRSNAIAIALAVSLAILPLGAQAAGLGKLTVLSPLGQTLKAELDITATREELSSLSARIAPAEAFRQMGIEFAPVAASIRLTLDKRPDGQPFLVVTSDRPVNDPFLDILVELSWTAGRVVREYTFLLDPPEIRKAETAPPPVAMPEVKPAPVVAAPAAVPVAPAEKPSAMPEMRATAPVDEKLLPKEAGKAEPAPKAAAEAAATRTVKRGDTLARIAAESKPAGVSLDQTLVALFNRNKDVFDGANMNRLRAGKILDIPDAEAVRAVESVEARKIIVAHAADFDAYRKKLAAAAAAAEPAKEEAPRQAVAGKITPKVEDKAPAPGKDKLEVSRTEPSKAAREAQGRIAVLEEDIVARDKALKEAGGRIAELEKNLGDLKKLAELKSQAGAGLQQQAQAAKPAPEAKPEPASAAPAPTAEKSAEAAAKPAAEAKPAEAPPSAEAKPAPKKPPVARKPAPPSPPPGFFEENPALLYGGGGILLLLLGYFGYKARAKKRAGAEMGSSRITESELAASSVFGAAGGQSVDTGAAMPTDFSQTGATAIDTDEGVDPVAEADVYMAYGRDAQAEEILIDALKNDPMRHAIHLKLLEIYAARKSLKQFETLASDLYGHTGGTGPDWEKAAAMGRNLDPENPLYGGRRQAPAGAVSAGEFDATIVVPPAEADKVRETVAMPGELMHAAEAVEAPAVPSEEAPAALDFDLDLGVAPAEAAPAPQPVEEVASLDFNLDLGAPAAPMTAENAPEKAPAAPSIDFDLGTPAAGGTETVAAPGTGPAAEAGNIVDFEFDLGEPVAAPEPSGAGEEQAAAMPLDLSAISLELGEPEKAQAPAGTEPAVLAMPEIRMEAEEIAGSFGAAAAGLPEPSAAPAPAVEEAAAPAEDNPEVATKIELAQAYEEMGDDEGARELLREVLNEGSSRQQEIARAKLAQLEG